MATSAWPTGATSTSIAATCWRGTPFNECAVGDTMSFEVLEDRFSGPRALSIKRTRTAR